MKKLTHVLIIGLLLPQFTFAQENPITDSSQTFNEVVITAFEQNRATSWDHYKK
ncbi:MAG TPA: hypothetical protein VK489_06520 [Ferruginibacter sp.]|nr:hypothetical protein [Ferruginibacter sp.]